MEFCTIWPKKSDSRSVNVAYRGLRGVQGEVRNEPGVGPREGSLIGPLDPEAWHCLRAHNTSNSRAG